LCAECTLFHSSASGSNARCPKGHSLQRFSAEHSHYSCDACRERVPEGSTLCGCRECDFDLCASCEQHLASPSEVDARGPYNDLSQLGLNGGLLCVRPTTICLNWALGESSTNELELKNTSVQTVAFKVRTNLPKLFAVKPVYALLAPGDSCQVKVMLKPLLTLEIEKQPKFLVMACPTDGSSENEDIFITNKAKIENTKVTCTTVEGGALAGARSNLNAAGNPVARGRDASWEHKMYCGKRCNTSSMSDGMCGPSNGPPCSDCNRMSAPSQNRAGAVVSFGVDSSCKCKLYCGRYLGRTAIPGSPMATAVHPTAHNAGIARHCQASPRSCSRPCKVAAPRA
jgi:hypothetical protein